MRIRSSLAGRLFLVAMVLAAPLFGYEIYRATAERRDAVRRARTDVLALARTAALRQDESLQEAMNLMRMLMRIPSVTAAADGECHAILRDIVNEHPSASRIQVVGVDGHAVCSSHDPRPMPTGFSDRTWFRDAMAPDAPAVVISELLVARDMGTPIVVVAGRVPGSVPGRVVSIALTPDWLPEIAAALAGHAGAMAVILNARDGTLLARSSVGGDVLGRAFPDHPLLTTARAVREGTADVRGFDDVERITGFMRLPGDSRTETIVAVGLARAETLAGVDRRLLQALGVVVGLALLGMAGALLAAVTLFVRPLGRLTTMAQALGAGNLAVRIDPLALPKGGLRRLGVALNDAVTRLQARDGQLSALASRDGLTGQINRRGFDEVLLAEWERAGRSGAPFVLAMVDLDHFKRLNDRLGHAAGDECLKTIGRALKGTLRFNADTLARYGGEEFAAILPNTTLAEARSVAARMVATVSALGLPHPGSEFGVVTISVGVAVQSHTSLTASPAELLAAADRALYAAKEAGRNRCVTVEAVAA